MKPILFNTNMVKAILDGRKTVTRRIVKPQPHRELRERTKDQGKPKLMAIFEKSSPYKVGDILYIRETFMEKSYCGTGKKKSFLYKADMDENVIIGSPWKPSIHMPKEAARIFLKVTSVRVERLQEITAEQAKFEGCEGFLHINPLYDLPEAIHNFKNLWDSTLKKDSEYLWTYDPWVRAIEFERISKEEAQA